MNERLWAELRALTGQTVESVRGYRFLVVSVEPHKEAAVTIEPQRTGKPRKLYRQSLEAAYQLWLKERQVTPAQVREHGLSERNPAYVAALINRVGPRV